MVYFHRTYLPPASLSSSLSPISSSAYPALRLVMGGQVPWLDRLHCLAARFDAFKATAFQEPDRKLRTSRFQTILQDICAVVREAEHEATPELKTVVEEAHILLETCLRYACSDEADIQSLNTFAHSDDCDEPWIDDIMENAGM